MEEVLPLPQGMKWFGVREPGPFIGVPSKRAEKQLSGSADDLVKGIATVIDQFITGAIEKRSASEFNAALTEVFPNYARVTLALGTLVKALVPPLVLEQLVRDSLCEMEADFRDHALGAFGAAMRDQALFTVWTLRKINDLSQRLSNSEVAAEQKEKDKEFAWSFVRHVLWMRFNLDCLSAAIRHQRPIYPEVLGAISDGLRAGVDAYAWIRQCVDLRTKIEEPTLPFIELDEEDRQFIDASARDMAIESA